MCFLPLIWWTQPAAHVSCHWLMCWPLTATHRLRVPADMLTGHNLCKHCHLKIGHSLPTFRWFQCWLSLWQVYCAEFNAWKSEAIAPSVMINGTMGAYTRSDCSAAILRPFYRGQKRVSWSSVWPPVSWLGMKWFADLGIAVWSMV